MFNFLKKSPKVGQIWSYNISTRTDQFPIFDIFGAEVRILGIDAKGIYTNHSKFPIPKNWQDPTFLTKKDDFLLCYKFLREVE